MIVIFGAQLLLKLVVIINDRKSGSLIIKILDLLDPVRTS